MTTSASHCVSKREVDFTESIADVEAGSKRWQLVFVSLPVYLGVIGRKYSGWPLAVCSVRDPWLAPR